MRLETIASSEPNRELQMPEKPSRMSDNKVFISYKGSYFEVPGNWLEYLTRLPKNIKKSNEIALQRGLMSIYPDGSFGCGYCNYMTNNPIKACMEGCSVAAFSTEGNPGISVKGCAYDNKEFRYAKSYKSPEGQIVTAWATPCAAHDAEIQQLVESGQLDTFQIKTNKEFPAIKDLASKSRLSRLLKAFFSQDKSIY